MRKWLSVFLISILSVFAAKAQITFERIYNRIGNDAAYDVAQCTDGGFILAGSTDLNNIFIIRTNAYGDTIWSRHLGYIDAYSVKQTIDGGFIITGSTLNPDTAGGINRDLYLIKTNPNGDTLWTRRFGGKRDDVGFCVAQTIDSGYIVTGETNDSLTNVSCIFLVKTNTNGNLLWKRKIGNQNHCYSHSVHQTTDGGYIISGSSENYTSYQEDVYLVKTNSTGDTLWTRTYGGTQADYSWDVVPTNDGGYIVGGTTGSYGAGSNDFYAIKTNANGDTLWTRTYGGIDIDELSSIVQTNDGGYALAGITYSFGAGNEDVYLVRINSVGDTLWTRTFGGALYDGGHLGMVKTSDGGFAIGGMSNSYGALDNDFYLIKTDENGFATAIAENSKITNNTISISPNPATTNLTIQTPLTSTIGIFDLEGQCLKTLPNAQPTTTIDVSGLPAGIYFIKATSEKGTEVRKFIKE